MSDNEYFAVLVSAYFVVQCFCVFRSGYLIKKMKGGIASSGIVQFNIDLANAAMVLGVGLGLVFAITM